MYPLRGTLEEPQIELRYVVLFALGHNVLTPTLQPPAIGPNHCIRKVKGLVGGNFSAHRKYSVRSRYE